MTERTTVRLPGELLGRAKRRAAQEGRTLTSIIEEGVRRVLDDTRQTARTKKVAPPVSTAKGWLRPGVRDLRDVQALEDLEYVERLKTL